MRKPGPLIYRQRLVTRVTHWLWAICLVFLLFSGLQIFMAHPVLQIGIESGFDYDNAALTIGARQVGDAVQGVTTVLGRSFETTGVLGVSGGEVRALPAALTMPSGQSLATGRVIHFFFAWGLVVTLALWAGASVLNGHMRALIPSLADLRGLPGDLANHIRLRFHHGRTYNVLQKLAYGAVLFVAFPVVIASGLTMSPGLDAAAPWLLDLFGGRQTARTVHFLTMLALVGFFVVHMAMILAAGPLNELRSMVTGWYRTDAEAEDDHAA